MIKLILIASLFLMFNSSCNAQTNHNSSLNKNGIYAEVYLIRHDFSDGFVSINYERNVGKKNKTKIRVGIYPDFESTISIPFTVSRVTRPLSNHHFEYGLGAVFRVEHFIDPSGFTEKEWFYDVPAFMIPMMYRYQNKSGLYFRAGINLFVSWPTLLSPSISVGYQF